MKFKELPQEVQDRLLAEIAENANKFCDGAFELKIYSKEGTRGIYARRSVGDCVNKYGHSWRLGGAQNWTIRFFGVQFERYTTPVGTRDWRLCESKTFGALILNDGTRIEIPKTLPKKKDVLALIASMPIFDATLIEKKRKKR
jgi:hypothetical protein